MSESGMMDALTWLHTSTDAPPALLKNAEVQADETASTITNVNTPATPEAAPANLKKPETTRPIEASVDPLREARVSLFRGKGLSTNEAERLADILAERDSTLDNRRACLECAGLHEGRCLQGRYPLGQADIFTLHRCTGFKPSEVSHVTH